jgi:DNA-binding XRE family transcriptional regulator
MEQTESDIIFKLKEVRRKLGLTQEALAHRIGVSFTSVNRWENGQTNPSPLARRQIEELFENKTKGTSSHSEAYNENKR